MQEDIDIDKDIEFQMILKKIFEARGVDFKGYRPKCIQRRVLTRMRVTGAKNYQEYMIVLKNNPNEYEKLFNALTINVTEFFRDPEIYDILRYKVLPEIIAAKEKRGRKTIRIWSAGSSDGQEAYSVAILLHEILGNRLFKDFVVHIHGTDIDEDCLKRAQEGVYTAKPYFKSVSLPILRKYFTFIGGDRYAVSDKLRIITKFKRHDLALDKPLTCMDLILCRNVLIYFSRELQFKVFENFHKALFKDGYLILGKTETVWGETQKFFTVVDHKNKICKRK